MWNATGFPLGSCITHLKRCLFCLQAEASYLTAFFLCVSHFDRFAFYLPINLIVSVPTRAILLWNCEIGYSFRQSANDFWSILIIMEGSLRSTVDQIHESKTTNCSLNLKRCGILIIIRFKRPRKVEAGKTSLEWSSSLNCFANISYFQWTWTLSKIILISLKLAERAKFHNNWYNDCDDFLSKYTFPMIIWHGTNVNKPN